MTDTALSPSAVLERFALGADRLSAALDGLDDAGLDCREAPGEWSIRQIVHHLADDCDVWSMCVKKAIAIPGAFVRFEGFPGNQPWADGLDFHVRSIDASLALFQAHRRYLSGLLDHFAAALDRSIDMLDEKGAVVARLTVSQIANMLADHLDEHLATIERIKGAAR